MKDQYFHLEFDVATKASVSELLTIFQKIKEEKEKYHKTHTEPDVNISTWESYLSPEAKDWFANKIPKEGSQEQEIFDQLWQLSKPEVRIHHPIFKTEQGWDFESMLYTVFQGDYELITIEVKEAKGILFFDPGGFPFGGTESLVQLIESFGHQVTYDSWHEGPHLREEAGWDYGLAQQLVAEGKGVEEVILTKKRGSNKWWQIWK